jgi:hypothetical protein
MNPAAKAAGLLQAVTDADLERLAGAERVALRQLCEDILRRTATRRGPPKAGVLHDLVSGARAD